MHIEEFNYVLPPELIAAQPLAERSHSRLLIDSEPFTDAKFSDICTYLQAGDLLIRNDTRVIKARLFGNKPSGGKVEVMLERVIDPEYLIAHIRTSKSIKLGMEILLAENLLLTVVERLGDIFRLKSSRPLDLYAYLDQHGTLPLPPYMQRQAVLSDETRYQTVYARHLGSVAAPTAGLHFTPELLSQIAANRIRLAEITLHVGSGTFKPVAVENIHEHKMHAEHFNISQHTIDLIQETKANGGKIVAVGTTTLRTLETVAQRGFSAQSGETNIFITPGFKFRLVDKLITNFHLPKSTLLMLVAAFSGKELITKAYQHAIQHQYRFFSYGDAMLLTRNQ